MSKGYNDELYKYYVRFHEKNDIKTGAASGEENLFFYYKQSGNYKVCGTSTDMSVQYCENKTFIAKFSFSSSWTIEVTSKNHQKIGVCFWLYRVWHGALWQYNEWQKPYSFYLYDQYGNSVNIRVNVTGGGTSLGFEVIKH
ncbi:hypothetical protein HGO23_15405 [Xenorhabdus budapestensis]|uniref:Uncharacterized protein n=1 Tax=Xenorhabdus budapestensis TaxID=290110 RepID=A0ABX7VEL3_XENBU|nr:hypothetical protein [Xenorhabdus budapestensis]QTL39204.1 hypothetical protein HGO23_15405 [Xenorhabdus budapestensis]